MARVPISPGQTVDPAAVQPVFQSTAGATPAAFGALQADAAIRGAAKIDQFGDDLARRALQAQQFDNERALKQADVTLADKIRTITYGDGTAQNPGYYSTRGDNAISAAGDASKAIDGAYNEVLSGLPNDRTKAIFQSVGRSRVVSEQSVIGRHVADQRIAANNSASVARMDAALNDAATRWNEPAQLQKALGINTAEVADYAARNGLSQDAAAKMLRDQNAKLISNVVKAAGRVDFDTALKIVQDNKDVIPGAALASIERELRTDQEFQRTAREHAQLMADRAATKVATGAYDQYVSQLIDPSNPNGLDLHAIASDPRLATHPELKVHLFNMQTAADKEEAPSRVSAATVAELYPRIHLPDDDPNKITDPRELDAYLADKKVTRADLKFLRDEIKDDQDPQAKSFGPAGNTLIQAMSRQIQGSTVAGLPDPARAVNAARYIVDTTNLLRKAREKGEDLAPYFNPTDPKYIASPAVQARYMRSMQDVMTDTVNSISRPTGAAVGGAKGTPQREPGETIEQYLKRTGK